MKLRPRVRWTMRPGQTWQRLRKNHFDELVLLLKKSPGGKRWLVLDLATGVEREERFTTRDSWRRV